MKFTDPAEKELERVKALKKALNNRTNKKPNNLLRWTLHPWNSFKRFLLLKFPNIFHL